MKKPHRSSAAAIAKGRLRALRERGITIDKAGRARKGGAFLSSAALKRAVAASAKKRRPVPRKPTKKPTRKPPKKPARKPTKKPTRKPKPPRKPPAPAPAPPSIEEAFPALTRREREALKALPPEVRAAQASVLAAMKPETRRLTIEALLKEREGVKPTKKEEKAAARVKRVAEEARKAKEEKKRLKTAKEELRRAVRSAAENPKRAYGYDPKLKTHQKIKGLFAGYKWTPFNKRAGHVQERLKEKFPKDFRRDMHTQAVHVREYMTQGDGGAGRRAIIEKTLLAGRRCIDERLVNKKTGKPLRIYQMYIARIRILVRIQDTSIYRGYATRPIEGKKSKAVTDIRGLEGFEKVQPNEDPKAALDRLIERLEVHLDDNILDGLPVVYVKSLEIKFDTEPQ